MKNLITAAIWALVIIGVAFAERVGILPGAVAGPLLTMLPIAAIIAMGLLQDCGICQEGK